MWKSKKFFVLVIMSVSMSFFSCTGVRGMFYDPPIPTQDYFMQMVRIRIESKLSPKV